MKEDAVSRARSCRRDCRCVPPSSARNGRARSLEALIRLASLRRVSTDAPLIHARDLRKQFGALIAVDGIDFDVSRGEAFGFLGPNGAGKSSTMRMIGCVSPPSGGTLRILGLDPVRDGPSIRARLGVVPQLDTLDTELTVRENLIIYGRYFGLSRKEVS